MGKMLITIFFTMVGPALCNTGDEYSVQESRIPVHGDHLAYGSRPYPPRYIYYPSYGREEMKKPLADDMFLIEGGVYWPHDPDGSYSSSGTYGSYGNKYGTYRPRDVSGFYSNWQGSASVGSNTAASSVSTEDDKDYNDYDDEKPAESYQRATVWSRGPRSPLRRYIPNDYYIPPMR